MNSLLISFLAATMLMVSEGGTIRGTVKMPGRSNADAVVYLEDAPGLSKKPPAGAVKMDQRNMLFIPHVLPVVLGTTVEFFNNDDVLHNVYTPSEAGEKFNLGTWAKGQTRKYTFKKLGEAVMLCNVHPDMEAWIVVTPTSHFATTDKSGAFSIPGVPAGNYVLKVWHQRYKAPEQKVTVPATGEVSVNFELAK
jgi:plastocyanin